MNSRIQQHPRPKSQLWMRLALTGVIGLLFWLNTGCQMSTSSGKTWLKSWRKDTAKWKGVHFMINTPGNIKELTEEIPELAAAGVNVLILEVNYHFYFQSHPELRASTFITPDMARQVTAEARTRGIRVIPMFNCVGHQSWAKQTFPLLTKYPQFDETPGQYPANTNIYCRSWCTQNPEVNKVVFALADELIEAFDADAFHIGMDEIFLIGSEYCPRCRGKDPAQLLAKAINDFHVHIVKDKNLELLLWGDRLLDSKSLGYSEWEAARNGTHPAVDSIPKDIIICDWHYGKQTQYPSVPFLTAKGFRVWPAGWQPVEAAKAFSAYSRQQDSPLVLGYLCTTWGRIKIPEAGTWPPLVESLYEWP
jgi:hypothetical protein